MAKQRIGILETKTHLSEIIQKVEAGERFVITRRGRAVAELRPVEPEKLPLERGCAASPDYWMSPDFDEPLEDLADYMCIATADATFARYGIETVW